MSTGLLLLIAVLLTDPAGQPLPVVREVRDQIHERVTRFRDELTTLEHADTTGRTTYATA